MPTTCAVGKSWIKTVMWEIVSEAKHVSAPVLYSGSLVPSLLSSLSLFIQSSIAADLGKRNKICRSSLYVPLSLSPPTFFSNSCRSLKSR